MSSHFARYQLESQSKVPVTLAVAKSYLKLPPSVTADDDLVTLYLSAATDFAEHYMGRDLRDKTWTLFLDTFPERIALRRFPVDSITSIRYLDDVTPTPSQQTVASSVYFLKHNVQISEVLLDIDQIWPIDVNCKEGTVEVLFVTVGDAGRGGNGTEYKDQSHTGILRHVAYLYENRGDCDPSSAASSAKLSGATFLYDQFRVVRV